MDAKHRQILDDPNVELFLLPTPKMQQMIALNEHPIIKSLTDHTKANFMAGYGIPIETKMAIAYSENTLDEKNKFLLDLGEIRIFGAEEVIIKKMK